MVIYFLRHGETDYNVKGYVQGIIDQPLNQNGERQARQAGAYLHSLGISFSKVYSSALQRARRTAGILSGLPEDRIVVDSRLREMSFGAAEGRHYQVIEDLFFQPDKYVPPEKAETIEHLCMRCADFLKFIGEMYGDRDDSYVILAVTHGAAMRGLQQCLDPVPRKDFWRGDLENLAGLKVRYEQGSCKLERVVHPLREYRAALKKQASGK